MNLEERSFRNLVWFYAEELNQVRDGVKVSKLLTERARIYLKRQGILQRASDGRRVVPTSKAVNVLRELS